MHSTFEYKQQLENDQNGSIDDISSWNVNSNKSKYLDFASKSTMRATKRSIALEIIMYSFGFAFGTIHFFFPKKAILLYSTGILMVVFCLIWIYTEVHKKTLLYFLSSFRGFIITLAIITITICDTLRLLLTSDSSTYKTLLDDCVWSMSIFILISADCVPSITNFLRFIGPLTIILNAINNIFIYSKDMNVTLISFNYGEITLNQIEIAATIEMILFGSSFILGVPRDPKHEYFVVLNDRVKKKQLLPLMNYCRDMTNISNNFKIKTKLLFVSISTLGIFLIIIYISDAFKNVWLGIVWNCVLIILLLMILVTLMYNHFEKTIVKHLIFQFRYNMLLLSIVIICYCGFQKLHWSNYTLHGVMQILNSLLFNMGIFLMIIKDGLLINYPFYFSFLLSLTMFAISVYNIYMLTFDKYYLFYPIWFVYLEKEAYYQVIVLSILILWNLLIRDRDNKYFTLIRHRKKCKEIFYDENQLEIARNLQFECSNDMLLNNSEINLAL